MNKAGVTIISILVVVLLLCSAELFEAKAKVKEQQQEIVQSDKRLVETELELQDKIKYIDTLNQSVEDLNLDVVTLETKLNELSIASDKLK